MERPMRVIVSVAALIVESCTIGITTTDNDRSFQSLREGLPPLWQRFANLSAIPGRFPCEPRERTCFQYGRLLNINADGKARCYPVGSRGPCNQGEVFHIDVEEAFRRGGRLRGTCGFPCGFIFRTRLHNDKCQWQWRLHEQLCVGALEDSNGKKLPSVRAWNRNEREWLCVCRGNPCPSRQLLATPDGVCTAPDLLNPTTVPRRPNVRVERFSCTRTEINCLHENRILYNDRCHKTMEQGPCRDGEWLVASVNHRMKARCERRPCPEGQLLVPSTGHCLSEEQIASFLCPLIPLHVDRLQGTWYCSWSQKHSLTFSFENPYTNEDNYSSSHGMCISNRIDGVFAPEAGISCARNDFGECARNVVMGTMRSHYSLFPEDDYF